MDTNALNSASEEEPEKYIRTFAGDMETLKGGGTPDLAPLAPEPQERLIASSPLQSARASLIPEPELTQRSAPPLAEPKEAAPAPKPEEEGPASLETYAGDFSDRLKETHASAISVLAAEQDSARAVPTPAPPSQEPQESVRNNLPYIIIGAVLLVAGIAGGGIAYVYHAQTTAPVVVAPSVPAPIFVDEREQVSGSGAALAGAIKKSVDHIIGTGSVRLLYMASSTDGGSVFSALGVSAPNVLLRNIQPGNSMAGVVNTDGVQSPFFILSVSSYSETFSGMLSWEPLMRRDLIMLFPPYPAAAVSTPPAGNSTTSSTTSTGVASASAPAAPAALSPITFTDDTVANHDVRIYRDSEGRSIVLYGYWNQTTLIIARDPAAFTEITQRLATSRTQ